MENKTLEFRFGKAGKYVPLIIAVIFIVIAGTHQSNVNGYCLAFFAAIVIGAPFAKNMSAYGEAALRELVGKRPDALGIMPRPFDKIELFGYIRRFGVLPRKTFSMGHAHDKRFYLEARKIK